MDQDQDGDSSLSGYGDNFTMLSPTGIIPSAPPIRVSHGLRLESGWETVRPQGSRVPDSGRVVRDGSRVRLTRRAACPGENVTIWLPMAEEGEGGRQRGNNRWIIIINFFLRHAVRVTELVHEALGALRLLHDALLVVLADGAAQLVVVHGGPILALAPQACHLNRVLDLEDALRAVQPADAGPVQLRLGQQLFQELPQVDVGARSPAGRRAAATADGPRTGKLSVVADLVCPGRA